MARNSIAPVMTRSTKPATVQGSIFESICDTGTLVYEMPNNRRSTMAMVPTNSMMDITCVDSVIAYMYSDSCSPMLHGVSANLPTSPSIMGSPLLYISRDYPLITRTNL